MTKFFVKTEISKDGLRWDSYKDAFKNYNLKDTSLSDGDDEYEDMILDTEQGKNQIGISYSEGFFKYFSIKLYTENGSEIGELRGHFEDISAFADSDLIDVGDATSQETFDCQSAFINLLEEQSDDVCDEDYPYEVSYFMKGLDRKTCIGIPDVFKPLFITYMDIKDKDVSKTLFDNLASIIFKDSYFMPQLICLINKHLDENDKEILNYCGFENNSKIYYKSCGLLEDELNQY